MIPLDLDTAAAESDVWPPICAVDPGGAHSGIAYRYGTSCWEAVTVDAPARTGDHTEQVRCALHVVEMVKLLVARHVDDLAAEAVRRRVDAPVVRHSVETLVAPTAVSVKGKRLAVAPSVLATLPPAATVLGAVVGTWPGTLLVPPRGHDGGWESLDRSVYPDTLRDRTPPGWLRGSPERKHARSAWAQSGVAHFLAARSAPSRVPEAHVEPSSPLTDERSLVGNVVAEVVAAGPDQSSAESILRAVRGAIADIAGAEALVGREAALVAACVPGLTGRSASNCREQAEQLRAETIVLLSGRVVS